jgi:hypothetical protein
MSASHPSDNDAKRPPINLRSDFPPEQKFRRLIPLLTRLSVYDCLGYGRCCDALCVLEATEDNMSIRTELDNGWPQCTVGDTEIV